METLLGESKLLQIAEPLYEVKHTADFTGKGTKANKLALSSISVNTESVSFPDTQSLALSSITSTDRDALSPSDGTIIYNDTTNRFEFYQNGAWVYYTANAV